VLAYAGREIDWTDPENHKCNNNRFSSRGQQYFGVDYQPLEVVFHKLIWPVPDTYTNPAGVPKTNLELYRRYTKWMLSAKRAKTDHSLRYADVSFNDEEMHY